VNSNVKHPEISDNSLLALQNALYIGTEGAVFHEPGRIGLGPRTFCE